MALHIQSIHSILRVPKWLVNWSIAMIVITDVLQCLNVRYTDEINSTWRTDPEVRHKFFWKRLKNPASNAHGLLVAP